MAIMHEGHRRRVRERYRSNGFSGFSAHEVLELLLFYIKPRGDVNPLAHRLLDAFGSLHGVLEAAPEQLMQVEGVGEESAAFLSMLVPLMREYQESRAKDIENLTCPKDVMDYCVALLSGYRVERMCVVLLDGKGRRLGLSVIAEGSLDEVQAYPRKVVEAALTSNAHSVILCHNHPGGSLEPSSEDIACTKEIRRALKAVGVQLLDHVVVSNGKGYSMSEMGMLDKLFIRKG